MLHAVCLLLLLVSAVPNTRRLVFCLLRSKAAAQHAERNNVTAKLHSAVRAVVTSLPCGLLLPATEATRREVELLWLALLCLLAACLCSTRVPSLLVCNCHQCAHCCVSVACLVATGVNRAASIDSCSAGADSSVQTQRLIDRRFVLSLLRPSSHAATPTHPVQEAAQKNIPLA